MSRALCGEASGSLLGTLCIDVQRKLGFFSFNSFWFNTFFSLTNIPDKSKLLLDVSARLWFTYRRKFSPIGEYAAEQLPCYKVGGSISDGLTDWKRIFTVPEHFSIILTAFPSKTLNLLKTVFACTFI